jgi:O-antigen ligase
MSVAVATPRRRRLAWIVPRSAQVGDLAVALLGFALLALVCVFVGRGVATGSLTSAASVAALPALLLVVWALVAGNRSVLVFGALGMNLIPFTSITSDALVGPIYLSDLIVALALLTWLADRMTGTGAEMPRTPVLGLPLLIFAFALLPGIIEGANRYGSSFFGQPARLVLYAGIAGAFTRLSARDAYRGIVVVFYVGTVLQVLAALYYLAAGGSATHAENLSTGGTRVVALSTAMYLAAALFLALLNLQLDPRRRLLHVAVAGMALFGVIVSYGRTTYIATAVLLIVAVVALPAMRRGVAFSLPIVVPLAIVVAMMLPSVAPHLIPTFKQRINPSVQATDPSLRWREQAISATLEATAGHRTTGAGFGATRVFTVAKRTFKIGGDPHNSYVYLLAGGGYVALGGFCLLLVVYLVDAVRRLLRSRGVERALVAFSLSVFFIFIVNALTGPIMTVAPLVLTFWAALLLPSLVRAGADRSDRS